MATAIECISSQKHSTLGIEQEKTHTEASPPTVSVALCVIEVLGCELTDLGMREHYQMSPWTWPLTGKRRDGIPEYAWRREDGA